MDAGFLFEDRSVDFCQSSTWRTLYIVTANMNDITSYGLPKTGARDLYSKGIILRTARLQSLPKSLPHQPIKKSQNCQTRPMEYCHFPAPNWYTRNPAPHSYYNTSRPSA